MKKIERFNQVFACLYLPDAPIEAMLVRSPELRISPCAVIADSGRPGDPKAPLLAVNLAARLQGVRVGESLARSRVRCPALRLLPCNPEAEREIYVTLLGCAEALSPDFERLRPDTLILDLAGSRVPTAWNPPLPCLRLVFAETPDLAHLAAMTEGALPARLLKPMDFDPLPLEVLSMAGMSGHESLLPLLRLWGLRSLGDFRQLPRQGIAERLGPDAARMHDILHGGVCRLLRLCRPTESFVQINHFEYPIESLEALLFQVNRMFQTLCARLKATHRAAGKIRFMLSFESSDSLERSILLPEPLDAPAALLRPLHTVFETLQTPSGIVALELELEPVLPLAAQREWLGRQLRQPARWPDTLARLEALLGPGRVGIPQPEDSHRPDAFRLNPASGAATVARKNPLPDVSPLPLRRFRPPLEVAVASSGSQARPRPLALLTGPHPGPIAGVRGPFPLSGDWWNPGDAWRRLEWDIELESRHLFRLVFIPPDRWQLDGAYA